MQKRLLILSTLITISISILGQGDNGRQFFHDKWEAKTYSIPSENTVQTLNTSATPDATISFNTENKLNKVLPQHLGVNTTFRNGNDQLDRTSLYTNAGIGSMRFPAGSGSNKYFYDGTIPDEFRIEMTGINGQNSNYMTLELFVDFIGDAGSEATVVVNYFYARYGITTEGTREARVQQAADYAAGFVHRMNIELNANITYWEIGNECYGAWEEGFEIDGEVTTGKEYGEDFRVFAEAMKAVDPDIKVGAVVTREDDDWNSTLLPEVKDHADFLVVHNYFTTVKDATAENILGSVGQVETIHTTLGNCIEKYTDKTRDHFPVAMTEFNSRGPLNCTMVNGLFVSQVIGEIIKNGYGMADLWVSEWNWNETDQESKGFLARSDPDQVDYSPRQSYIPFQYYNRCFGDELIESASNKSDIKVYASTFSSGELGLVVVNTSANSQSVNLDLSSIGTNINQAEVWWYELHGNSITAGDKKFYINNQSGTTQGGGPDDFMTIHPYYANIETNSIFETKAYSVNYIVLKTNEAPLPPQIEQSGATISISSETTGASIYYTVDGSEPTNSSTLYENPFNAPPGATIKAISSKDGNNSSVTTFKPQFNVLFIAIDDLKPVLNCYGESQIISPNIDRLANQGMVFTKAYCQWAVCGPSRASVMSGQTPDGTGIRNLSSLLREENSEIVTLPEYFLNKGYGTAACGKIYDPRNVDDSHDSFSWTIPYTDPGDYTYPDEYPPFVQGSAYRVTANTATEEGPEGIDDDGYQDGQIALDALNKMDQLQQNGAPFFLAVGFKKPHIPFIAPKKYWDMYDRSTLNLAPFQKIAEGSPEYAYHTPEPLGYDDIPDPWEYDDVDLGDNILELEHQRRLIHGYYASVSYIDAQVGKLLDKLDAMGQADNTIIVLYGDHGYHLGDHNQWGKHTQFENSVRAPLIISSPGMNSGTNATPVEFTDIYPTLCDLAGLEVPSNKLQGISLAPALRGESINKTCAVSEYRAGGGAAYSFRTDRYRLSLWLNGSNDRPDLIEWDASKIKAIELYDYDVDPLETKNLAADSNYEQVVNDLTAMAANWWGEQYAFFNNNEIQPIEIPYIEHFENYNVGDSFSGDFWLHENSIWDRLWKSTYVGNFSAEVIDDSANDGNNVLKVKFTPLATEQGGSLIKLRTIDMSEFEESTYRVTYKARTSALGTNTVKIGADISSDNWHTLNEDYQYFYDTVNLSNGKLFIYFNNMELTSGTEYEVIIDDLKISYAEPTDIDDSIDDIEMIHQVYPNPSDGVIHLISDYPIEKSRVYSIDGILLVECNKEHKQLNIHEFSKGLYILELWSNNIKTSHRIIKK
ncbi:sulfatase-like hydrolase/transferase [Carboxylicivirga sp. N1Y90]|uniref:sulfatase-like hydrolase/transferase n=1 Tax=Carboxylicivirga fragile TaxID=3417571 RepID=UPI003D349D4E|nr:sulfatase-like hydrolase/transferase [Marinilabiliaceae bacterium N1Y90]